MMDFLLTIWDMLEGMILGLLFMFAIVAFLVAPIALITTGICMITHRNKKDAMYKHHRLVFWVSLVIVALMVVCIAWLTDGFSQGISFM